MPEIPRSLSRNKLLPRAAATMAGLSLLGATLPHQASAETKSASAVPARSAEKPSTPASELFSSHIPEAVVEIMRRDTLRLSISGCSGEAIRDKNGQVIGATLAAHCVNTAPIRGTNGKYYVELPSLDEAQTGDQLSQLTTVATLDTYLLPSLKDKNHDLALAVALGRSPQEVIDAYRRGALTETQIRNLKIGDRAYLSGWPDYQPGSKEAKRRQLFALSILGIGRALTSHNKVIPVVWAAVPPSQDGAECSWGNSGGELFVIRNGKKLSVGTLAHFYDLGSSGINGVGVPGGPTMKQSRQNAVAICAFAYRLSTPEQGGLVVHAVESTNQIPGYQGPEEAIDNAHAKFNDPNYSKTVIDGTVVINALSGKGGPPQWIERPVLFHDYEHHNTIIVSAADAEDKAIFRYFSDDDLSALTFFPNQTLTQPQPEFMLSSGKIDYLTDSSGESLGWFVDERRLPFGIEHTSAPELSGSAYILRVIGGNLKFVQVQIQK